MQQKLQALPGDAGIIEDKKMTLNPYDMKLTDSPRVYELRHNGYLLFTGCSQTGGFSDGPRYDLQNKLLIRVGLSTTAPLPKNKTFKMCAFWAHSDQEAIDFAASRLETAKENI